MARFRTLVLNNQVEATDAAPDRQYLVIGRDVHSRLLAADPLRTGWLGRRSLDPLLLHRLSQAARHYDAILAESEETGWEAALSSAFVRRPPEVFIIFHGQRWWSRRNRLFAAVISKMPWVHLLCLSDSLRNLVVSRYKVPSHRAYATGYGVDSEFFFPALKPGSDIVVSAGTASRDYDTLVRASTDIGTNVKIAANSAWHKEQLNVQVSLPDSIEVLAEGNYATLRELYANACFVVVPLRNVDYAAGYAVIAEAMAMGKAVIATSTRCNSDLIADGVSGIYVPPNDPIALRTAMHRLISDPQLAFGMGQAGRRLVETKYSLDLYVQRIRETIEKVLSERRKER